MKKRNAVLILTGILCIASQYSSAQISEGGEPISFSIDIEKEDIPILTMPSVNVDSLLQEDRLSNKGNAPRPFKFGHAMSIDIDIKKAGVKKILSDGGNLWLLKIRSPGAFSINLIYSYFRLGEGSKLFVYNEDKSMVLGAFTSKLNNNLHNEFATDLVAGDAIILEYYEPKQSHDGVVRISKVIHGYVNTFSSGLGASAPCNIDVNCPLGNNWENEKRAVSMMLTNENSAFCTGSLINNTKQDSKPYYLTANHCLGGNTNTWIFRFKYWRPNCNSGSPSNWVSVTGSTIRANYAPTDVALLELNTTPPASDNVYYAGWDRTSTPAQNTTGIHHPRGDAMKISYAANPAIAVPWGSENTTHWRVTFNQGIVQHGSSGAPLFNQHHRIVGQLHGNYNNICHSDNNTCFCAQTPIGEYGRFDISWTGGGTNSTRLSNWLDPINSGVLVLDGCGSIDFTNQTITTNTTVTHCGGINVQNVTVTPTGALNLQAGGNITINAPFEAQAGATLNFQTQ